MPGPGYDEANLAIAVIGLFGGTYGGVRVSHLLRHRAEDRRELRRVQIPVLREFLGRNPDSLSGADIEAFLREKRRGDRLVEGLPLADREQWGLVTTRLPAVILTAVETIDEGGKANIDPIGLEALRRWMLAEYRRDPDSGFVLALASYDEYLKWKLLRTVSNRVRARKRELLAYWRWVRRKVTWQ
jgi:hypothetical protein